MQKLNGPKSYFTLTQQEFNSQFKDVVTRYYQQRLSLNNRSGFLNCRVMVCIYFLFFIFLSHTVVSFFPLLFSSAPTFLYSNKGFISRTSQSAMVQETGCLISLRQNKQPHVSLSRIRQIQISHKSACP